MHKQVMKKSAIQQIIFLFFLVEIKVESTEKYNFFYEMCRWGNKEVHC